MYNWVCINKVLSNKPIYSTCFSSLSINISNELVEKSIFCCIVNNSVYHTVDPRNITLILDLSKRNITFSIAKHHSINHNADLLLIFLKAVCDIKPYNAWSI